MTSPPSVTVIGLGPMGTAMAGVFIDNGYPTTVFNRTPDKADDLVAAGAVRADTAAQALQAAELVIISLTHYRAMYELLGEATRWMSGRVLVNLSSDTPAEAKKAARWAGEHGATFLTAGIMVPAPLVGKPGASTFYSGPRDVLEEHRSTLEVLSAVDYRGADPGLALLWYQAQLDLFISTLASMLHAAAMVGSAGVTAAEFLPYAGRLMQQMPYFMQGMAEQIDNRYYPDAGASLAMMSAGVDHITEAARDASIDPGLPAGVQALYHRALAAGLGAQSSTSLIEVIKKPAHTAGATG